MTELAPTENGPAPETTNQEASETDGPIFWDNTQVPEDLRPTHRAMQAALTKAQQKIGDLGKVADRIGGADEAAAFLSRFLEPTGTVDWFKEVGLDMIEKGMDVNKLLGISSNTTEVAKPAVTSPKSGESSQTFSRGEVENMLAEFRKDFDQRDQVREIAQVMDSLQIDEEDRELVAKFVIKHPNHIGLKEQFKRGYDDYLEYVRKRAERLVAVPTKPDPAAPGIIRGTTPGSSPVKPKSIEEAVKFATEYMKANAS